MGLAGLLAASLALSLGAMLLLWLLSLRLRDASIVDVWWGPGFAALALASFALAERGHALVTALTVVWGLRLGLHLARRNLGHGEDPRYAAMRRRHGERFGRVSLVSVFGMQGLLMWLVSLPVQVANAAGDPAQLGLLELAGTALWGVGLFFEAVGDFQLARFRADPANAGRVLESGLWRYTRHPNYFGDCCAWWGIFLVALPAPGAWLTAPSPALMSFLLLRVSGVPLLERSLRKRRPGYDDYVRRTSVFFPLPPRRGG
jgi:steroid 5-alpha reductase family enzyme